MNNCTDLYNTLLMDKKTFSGSLNFTMGGIDFPVANKDVIGNIIQEWFGHYMISKKLKISLPQNSQTWPDFKIDSFNCNIEVKSFNYTAGPAFDISNFAAYVSSLISNPERLYDNHFVFAYSSTNGAIKIEEIWLKKIWEITGPSDRNITELQVKRGVPYNIRPKKFYSDAVDTYSDAVTFLTNLSKAIDKFQIKIGYSGSNWLKKVKSDLQL